MTTQTLIVPAAADHRDAVIALLSAEKLPVQDLPFILTDFFVAVEAGLVVGAIGLEQYEDCGLLRSMVVDKAHRGNGIATQLVSALEGHARTKGLQCLYLLTETASLYFEGKEYAQIGRDEVPEALKASSEFSHVCPSSAIVMKKNITHS